MIPQACLRRNGEHVVRVQSVVDLIEQNRAQRQEGDERGSEPGEIAWVRETEAVLAAAAPDLERALAGQGVLIVAGDWNAPSHLDWTASTAPPVPGSRDPVADDP